MSDLELCFHSAVLPQIRAAAPDEPLLAAGGRLFLEARLPDAPVFSDRSRSKAAPLGGIGWGGVARGRGFLSVSLSVKGGESFARESVELLGKEVERRSEVEGLAALEAEEEEGDGVPVVLEVEKNSNRIRTNDEDRSVQGARASALNTTKHLWAGAVAAMVSSISSPATCKKRRIRRLIWVWIGLSATLGASWLASSYLDYSFKDLLALFYHDRLAESETLHHSAD